VTLHKPRNDPLPVIVLSDSRPPLRAKRSLQSLLKLSSNQLLSHVGELRQQLLACLKFSMPRNEQCIG